FYVGESVDLRARMGGHAGKWGAEIIAVRLLPTSASKQQLKRYERILTHELERWDVPIRDVLNASITAGRDALDELLPDAEQVRWLQDPRGYNDADATPLKEIAAQEVRYSTAARRYRERPQEPAVTGLLRTYLDRCVPVPRATEFQYWSVSTGTFGGSRFPRRFCVNVGKMEVFVVYEDKRANGFIRGFVNVRKSIIAPTRQAEREFKRRHPDVRIEHRIYDDAGGDLITLRASSLEVLARILVDDQVTAAAAKLVLDVMRKHFCVYTRYHCPQLVAVVYPEFPRLQQQSSISAASDTPRGLQPIAFDDQPTATDEPAVSVDEAYDVGVEDLGDVDCYWIVGCGPRATGRNQISDFVERGEWRMDPDPRYETKVADMLPGERIAVRTRRNVTDTDVPFDRRDNRVSVMDFHLRGTIMENPGDGCSVQVSWEPMEQAPKRYYLYTSQDTVWALARGADTLWDDLIGFVFDGRKQDVDFIRNLPFWSDRFGDR
ncbi:MAG: hypothetical protein WAW17_00120, partial [Rhodococcus sp. (in: high G+C Gram-positive bacteria)]